MPDTKNAARMFHEIEEAYAREERRKALSDPEGFVKLAAARGYNFTVGNLETHLDQLSDEDVAGIKASNTLVLPASVSDVGSMIALAMNVINKNPGKTPTIS